VPQDEEMRDRVQHHQQERGTQWRTIEEPIQIAKIIERREPPTQLILVDCLTLWISNLMLGDESEDGVHHHIDTLCAALRKTTISVIIVSNEVGAGIVPENALARRFRDLVGRANQLVAAACEQVIWMVAGIPVPIKPKSWR
ncbi:MAG: bifunctional adenosylcobinamide kinase/adenosylcobinamide-phosphate guanylyltransferase, partial [Desulfobacteraceae bacterium]|nr:bifunctional adenosylcobinamide kinase/adenosylcobinamide-phosphate guanylyltransferase [Desulfobacteraceae bacterium]